MKKLVLKRSLAVLGTSEFRSEVQDELQEYADELPLEEFMDHGGWPDPGSAEVTVNDVDDSVVEEEGEVYIYVTVSFDEEERTSCDDIGFSRRHQGWFRITMKTGDGSAEVEQADPPMVD